MSFCRFSTEHIANNKVEVDNLFFSEFLPSAPDICVKVYMYGLYLAKNQLEHDNTFEKFAETLNISPQDLETAFRYWEEQGLVQVLSTYPIQVVYKPLKDIISGVKLYKTEKYEKFNSQAQELFLGKRQITKTEYGEYYDFLEHSHMQQEALLMIMNYCIQNKKASVGYNYILTVARNWASEGVLTVAQVEEKLCQMQEHSSLMAQVLTALGIKRESFIEEREMLRKWKEGMGFEDEVILFVASSMKKRGGCEKLNSLLEKYFISGKNSIVEIKDFISSQQMRYDLAKSINKKLGLYYESLDNIVDTYITPWLDLGFEATALENLASYAFTSSIRTLDGLNTLVQKLYKIGVLSQRALDEYLMSVLETDKQIKKYLTTLGLNRRVNAFDRDSYKTWKNSWLLSDELISHAASLSVGKLSPLQYMSRLLANWHENKITSIEDIKKLPSSPIISVAPVSELKGRSYSKAEYQAMVQSIDEIEI